MRDGGKKSEKLISMVIRQLSVLVSGMAHIGRKGNHVNLDMRDRLIGENSRME